MKYLFILFVLFSISFVSAEVTYEMNWDEDEIINGKNFKIRIIVTGEDDRLYDGKLWIEHDGEIISDVYDSKEDEWKSSYYYVNEYFDGTGDRQRVKLRIDEEHRNFEGDAYINFRIRDNEVIKEEIEILSKEDEPEEDPDYLDEDDNINEEEKIENKNIVESVVLEPISLGQKIDTVEEKDINTEDIVYQSKGSELIEYSVYGFTILCVLLCVLIIWRKLD